MRTNQHDLKIDPLPFDLTVQGLKKCTVRKDDRDYQPGDTIMLRKTRFSAAEMAKGLPLEFTGDFAVCTVTHLMRAPTYGVPQGYAVMSLRLDATGWAGT